MPTNDIFSSEWSPTAPLITSLKVNPSIVASRISSLAIGIISATLVIHHTGMLACKFTIRIINPAIYLLSGFNVDFSGDRVSFHEIGQHSFKIIAYFVAAACAGVGAFTTTSFTVWSNTKLGLCPEENNEPDPSPSPMEERAPNIRLPKSNKNSSYFPSEPIVLTPEANQPRYNDPSITQAASLHKNQIDDEIEDVYSKCNQEGKPPLLLTYVQSNNSTQPNSTSALKAIYSKPFIYRKKLPSINNKLLFHIHANSFGANSTLEEMPMHIPFNYLYQYAKAWNSHESDHDFTEIIQEMENTLQLFDSRFLKGLEAYLIFAQINHPILLVNLLRKKFTELRLPMDDVDLQMRYFKYSLGKQIKNCIKNKKRVLIPGGWVEKNGGHAMYYEIIPSSTSNEHCTFEFRIHNLGPGIEYHSRQAKGYKNNYQPYASFKGISQENISNPNVLHILYEFQHHISYINSEGKETKTDFQPRDIYISLTNLLQPSVMPNQEEFSLLFKGQQGAGICAYKSILAFLHTRLIEAKGAELGNAFYKRFVIDLKIQSLAQWTFTNQHFKIVQHFKKSILRCSQITFDFMPFSHFFMENPHKRPLIDRVVTIKSYLKLCRSIHKLYRKELVSPQVLQQMCLALNPTKEFVDKISPQHFEHDITPKFQFPFKIYPLDAPFVKREPLISLIEQSSIKLKIKDISKVATSIMALDFSNPRTIVKDLIELQTIGWKAYRQAEDQALYAGLNHFIKKIPDQKEFWTAACHSHNQKQIAEKAKELICLIGDMNKLYFQVCFTIPKAHIFNSERVFGLYKLLSIQECLTQIIVPDHPVKFLIDKRSLIKYHTLDAYWHDKVIEWYDNYKEMSYEEIYFPTKKDPLHLHIPLMSFGNKNGLFRIYFPEPDPSLEEFNRKAYPNYDPRYHPYFHFLSLVSPNSLKPPINEYYIIEKLNSKFLDTEGYKRVKIYESDNLPIWIKNLRDNAARCEYFLSQKLCLKPAELDRETSFNIKFFRLFFEKTLEISFESKKDSKILFQNYPKFKVPDFESFIKSILESIRPREKVIVAKKTLYPVKFAHEEALDMQLLYCTQSPKVISYISCGIQEVVHYKNYFIHWGLLEYFSKQPEKLKEKDYQYLFQYIFFSKTLKNEIKHSETFTKELINFIKTHFDIFYQQSDFLSCIFLAQVTRLCQSFIPEVIFFETDIDMLRKILSNTGINYNERSLAYVEVLAHFNTVKSNYLEDEDVEDITKALVYLHFNPIPTDNEDPIIANTACQTSHIQWEAISKYFDSRNRSSHLNNIVKMIQQDVVLSTDPWVPVGKHAWKSACGKFLINPFTGDFRFLAGNSPINLPSEITSHPQFNEFLSFVSSGSRLIGKNGEDIYKLFHPKLNSNTYVQLNKNDLYIDQEREGGTWWRFIPNSLLLQEDPENDGSYISSAKEKIIKFLRTLNFEDAKRIYYYFNSRNLTENYYHWQSLTDPGHVIIVDKLTQKIAFQVKDELLIDESNGLYLGSGSPYFKAFEHKDYVEEWYDPSAHALAKISLPRFNLTFTMKGDRLYSDQYAEFYVAKKQMVSQLNSFSSFVLLINKHGEKKILLPAQFCILSRDIIFKHKMMQLEALIPLYVLNQQLKNPKTTYQRHIVCTIKKGLLTANSIEGNLYLAYVHALTQNYTLSGECLRRFCHKQSTYNESETKILKALCQLPTTLLSSEANLNALALYANFLLLNTNVQMQIKKDITKMLKTSDFDLKQLSMDAVNTLESDKGIDIQLSLEVIYEFYLSFYNQVTISKLTYDQELFLLKQLMTNEKPNLRFIKRLYQLNQALAKDVVEAFLKNPKTASQMMGLLATASVTPLSVPIKKKSEIPNDQIRFTFTHDYSNNDIYKIPHFNAVPLSRLHTFFTKNFMGFYKFAKYASDKQKKYLRDSFCFIPQDDRGLEIKSRIFDLIMKYPDQFNLVPKLGLVESYYRNAHEIKKERIREWEKVTNQTIHTLLQKEEALSKEASLKIDSFEKENVEINENKEMKDGKKDDFIESLQKRLPQTALEFSLDLERLSQETPLPPREVLSSDIYTIENDFNDLSGISPLEVSWKIATDGYEFNHLVNQFFKSMAQEPLDISQLRSWLEVTRKNLNSFEPIHQSSFRELKEDCKYFSNLDRSPIYLLNDNVTVEQLKEQINKNVIATISEMDTLRQKIFDEANKIPEDRIEEILHKLQLAGNKRRFIQVDEMIVFFALQRSNALREKNPYLSAKDISCLFKYVGKYLLLATHQHQRKRLLDIVEKIKPQQNDIALFQDLVNELLTTRCYDVNEYPAYLAFEYFAEILLRPAQKKTLQDFLEEGDFTHLIKEMIMGSGKSKVLLPLIGILRAKPETLSVIVVPKPLFENVASDTQKIIQVAFESSLNTLHFDRNTTFTEDSLSNILTLIHTSKKNLKCIIMTSHNIQCLILKYIESWNQFAKSDQKELPTTLILLNQILRQLGQSSCPTFDEVDTLLNVFHDVCFSLGTPKPPKSDEIEVVATLYELLYANESLLKISDENVNHLKKIARLESDSHPNPKAPVLTPDIYTNHLKQPLAEAFICRLPFISFNNPMLREKVSQFAGLHADNPLLMDYLCHNQSHVKEAMEFYESQDDDIKNILALAAQEISHFLHHTLNKISNENYGIDSESKVPTAIPFAAVFVPKRGSQFASEYITMNYCFQIYSKTNLSEQLIEQEIKRLQSAALKEIKDKNFEGNAINLEDTVAWKNFNLIRGELDFPLFNYKEHQFTELIKHINKDYISKQGFIKLIIIPQINLFAEKLTCNPQNLVSFFAHLFGFTGTLWNAQSMHRKLTPQPSPGIAAKTLQLIFTRSSNFPVYHCQEGNTEKLLNQFKDQNAQFDMIIDTGGYFKDLEPLGVARSIALKFKKSCVFYNHLGEQTITDGTKETPFIASKSELGRYLTFLDQDHTTGADVKQRREAVAVVTVGRHMLLRDFLQSVWRLRQLDNLQIATFALSDDVATIMAQVLKKANESDVYNVEEIARFAFLNQCNQQGSHNFKSLTQQLDDIPQQLLLDILFDSRIPILKKKEAFLNLRNLWIKPSMFEPRECFGSIAIQRNSKVVAMEVLHNSHSIIEGAFKQLSWLLEFGYSIDKYTSDADKLSQKMLQTLPAKVASGSINGEMNQSVEREQQAQKEVELELEVEREVIDQVTNLGCAYGQLELYQILPTHFSGHVPYFPLKIYFEKRKVLKDLADAFEGIYLSLNMFEWRKNSLNTIKLFGNHRVPYKYVQLNNNSLIAINQTDALFASKNKQTNGSFGGAVEIEPYHLYNLTMGYCRKNMPPITSQQRLLIVKAKFLNGDSYFKGEEVLLLKKWLIESGVEKMKKLYVTFILKGYPMKAAAFSQNSVLKQVFTALMENAEVELKETKESKRNTA